MGIYDADGKIRVTVGTVGATFRGLYNPDGSWNATISPGSGFVGAYAADGSLYVTDATGSTSLGRYALDGSLRVTTGSDLNGALKVSGLSTFSPASLFASSEQGVWLDPSDFSTMFQDSAGTTPVTAVGQPVGKINDKSGRGNHATQATAGSRPLLQQDGNGCYYLAFDGVDDYMTLPDSCMSNLQTSNQPFAMFAGARRETGGTFMSLFIAADNTDATAGNNDSVGLNFNNATSQIQANIRDYTGAFSDKPVTGGTYGFPSTCVATWVRSSSTGYVAVNQVAGTAADQTQPAIGLVLYTVGALRRGSAATLGSYLNGRLYSLIVRVASSTGTEISNTETWVNTKTMAY
jgi:hypothetical protein